MIVRPDWLRRKYIFSGAMIAASITLLLAMSRESPRSAAQAVRSRAPAWSESTTSYVVVSTGGAVKVTPVYDPWKPYDAPPVVRSEAGWGTR
jgi:hypothetical protein